MYNNKKLLIIIISIILSFTILSICSGEYTRFDIKIKKCLSTVLNVQVLEENDEYGCTISSGVCETSSFNIRAQSKEGQFYLNLYDDVNDCTTNPTVFIFDCNVIAASNITDYGAFNVKCYNDNELFETSSASKQPISIKKLASLIIFISSILLFIL